MRRPRVWMPLAAVAVIGVGIVVLGAIAFAGGFDRTTTARVRGRGTRVVRVELDHATLGLDVSPDVVTVDPGVHLVLDVVNRTDERHDLALDGGTRRTALLAPGASQRLDLGIVRHDTAAWCTLPGHKLLGMAMAIRVSAPPR